MTRAARGAGARYVLAVARAGFLRCTAYRLSSFVLMANNLVFGLIRGGVLIALFGARQERSIAGFSLPAVLTFTAISQALVQPLSLWGSWELAEDIQSGRLTTELVRPAGLYASYFARAAGQAAYHVVFGSAPLCLAFWLLYGMSGPAHPAAVMGFALAIVLAFCISFQWSFLINCMCFWTLDARGLGDIVHYAAGLLSGFLVPVAFFPGWLATVAAASPFPYMINFPAEVFSGRIDAAGIGRGLVIQASWAVGLTLVNLWLLHRGRRAMTVQGG